MKTIEKVAGCLIKDNKLLVVRSRGSDTYFSLGGKPEAGETEGQTLSREVLEEIGCRLTASNFLGRFEGLTASETVELNISVYLIEVQGHPKPNSEIDEIRWISANENIKLGSALTNHIIPKLIKEGLLR